MGDPFVDAVKGSIGGLSEVISIADDLDGVAKQVQDLGKKEINARAAWRRKQATVNGDYSFVNAVDEWNRVREAREMREQVRQEVIKRWGEKAWDEILKIEQRQKEDNAKLYTEDGLDKKLLFKVKLACFAAALFIVIIMWMTGVIREMSEAFYA